MEVLRGAKILLEKHKPDLLIEIHGFALPNFGSSSEEVLEFLSSMGYKEQRFNNEFRTEDYFQSYFTID
jgi:hypothetical protein